MLTACEVFRATRNLSYWYVCACRLRDTRGRFVLKGSWRSLFFLEDGSRLLLVDSRQLFNPYFLENFHGHHSILPVL